MELTNQYINQQSIDEEVYFKYREKKAKEFMELIKKGLGQNMTTRELKTIEFGFKKGMDTISKSGKFIAEEVIEMENLR